MAPDRAGHLLRRMVVIGLLAFAMACFLMPYTPLYALTIAVWNKERGDSAWYFAVWVALDTSVVLAAVVSAGDVAPVVSPSARIVKQRSRYRHAFAFARSMRHRLRCLRAKHASSLESRWLLVPFALAVLLSLYATLEMGVHQQAVRYDWGHGFVPSEHHGRQFWQQWMQKSALYAGVASLVPLSLLGLPLGRSAAMWRVAGLAYEEVIALHRALGHLTLALLTLHAMGYLVAWASQSLQTLLDELTDWARCGACTHINNSAGLLAWLAGLGMWATSLERFRRSRYAAFFAAHQAPNLSAHPHPSPSPSPSPNPNPYLNPYPNP